MVLGAGRTRHAIFLIGSTLITTFNWTMALDLFMEPHSKVFLLTSLLFNDCILTPRQCEWRQNLSLAECPSLLSCTL